MTKRFAYIIGIVCDVCQKTEATLEARDQKGDPIKIQGKEPNTKGWLIIELPSDGHPVHICPHCLKKQKRSAK